MSVDIAVAEEFFRLTDRFNQRAEELGLGDVSRYHWYHTIDLGEGLITPGGYDFRETIGQFPFPADMSGMTVLDVGSATGFFAFEFERRGADVISVELPSLDHFDRFPGQTTEDQVRKIERRTVPTQVQELTGRRQPRHSSQELYDRLLDGPFHFCSQRLGSRVRRCYSTIYDLTAARLGADSFDLIFVGDVLVHTLYPLRGLAALAPLCSGSLVLAQPVAEGEVPVMEWKGGTDLNRDDVLWWLPNRACFEQILRKLGFRTVRETGHHTGFARPSGTKFDRTILLAQK